MKTSKTLPTPFDALTIEQEQPAKASGSSMCSFRLPAETKSLLEAKAEEFGGNKTKALIAAIENL